MSAKRDPRRGGQILILMSLLTTTLIIMFGMVVAVGHLVQIKMNLQTAVDLAAMSGASYQARYLNHMALVNYRLRQNYKFALYDLYVTQSRYNVGLKEELRSGGGTFAKIPKNKYTFGICQQAYGFRPSEGGVLRNPGRPTAMDTDMCQNATGSCSGTGAGMTCQGRSIPPIEPYVGPLVNPELIAINETIKNLRAEQIDICQGSGPENEEYFYYLMRKLYERQNFQIAKMLEIAKAFDTDFGTGGEIKSNNPGSADRAIYATFVANLVSALHPSNAGGVRLEYLNPSDTRAPRGVPSSPSAVLGGGGTGFGRYFTANSVGFRILTVLFDFDSGSGCKTQSRTVTCPGGADCPPGEILVGMSRTRAGTRGGLMMRPPSTGDWVGAPVLVPFNVVLRATVERPRLLFWPTSLTPSISAVGAAKPFGSRIGPPENQTYLETQGVETKPTTPGLANMAFFPGDWGDPGGFIPGIGNKIVVKTLRDMLQSTGAWPDAPGSGQNNRRPSMSNRSGTCQSNPNQFACLALAPTLYESLFYNTYPFPPEAGYYELESVRTAFPAELNVGVVPGAAYGARAMPVGVAGGAGDAYTLPDRSDGSGNNILWHETVPQANDIAPGAGGKPTFFGSEESVLSSWSPAIRVDDFNNDWNNHGGTLGRMGFQIKLVSVYQVCKEIERGSGALGALSAYCKSPSMSPNGTPSPDTEILY
jgi:hypothetical protein